MINDVVVTKSGADGVQAQGGASFGNGLGAAGVSIAYRTVLLGDTGDVTTTDTSLIGFYITDPGESATMILKKGGSTGTAISGAISSTVGFHWFPALCPGGLHAEMTASMDVTFFVLDGTPA
jgi:hypothetical protein